MRERLGTMGQQKQGKNSKIGRNKDKCNKYRSEGRREQNKLRRIAKYNSPAFLTAWKDKFIFKKLEK
jgi:hypothetical protein